MQPTILHLDSSILGEQSVSRQLTAGVVARLQSLDPAARVVYRDLAGAPIPHLSGAAMLATAMPSLPQDDAVKADLALGAEVLQEFLQADMIVVGVPRYNFGIPSQLKAWIDRVAVAGKTFRYTAKGPEGLLQGKRVILVVSRSGFYGPGSSGAHLEHAESYLRGVFAFTGVQHIEVISADGLRAGDAQRAAALDSASRAIAELV